MTSWIGDRALIASAERALDPGHPVAAIALMTPHGGAEALRGAAPENDFEICSISKAITGMLYRASIERGRVEPTTTLGALLPLADHGAVETITLESLATHHSGLPRLAPGMQPWRRTWRLWTRGENPYGETLDQLLEQTRGIALGPPRARYSNLGFQLLGHAVAAAESMSYRDLLTATLGPGFATPHHADELRPTSLLGASRRGRPRAAWVGEAIAPAGGIRATIGTMRDLLHRILDGTAPGLSALDAHTPYSPGVRIGAGWITLGRPGREITWHNGGTGGFRSYIGVDRTAGVGVVVLSARDRSVDRAGFALLREHAPER